MASSGVGADPVVFDGWRPSLTTPRITAGKPMRVHVRLEIRHQPAVALIIALGTADAASPRLTRAVTRLARLSLATRGR